MIWWDKDKTSTIFFLFQLRFCKYFIFLCNWITYNRTYEILKKCKVIYLYILCMWFDVLDIGIFFIKNNLKYEDWYERHHAFNQWISIVLKRFIKHVSTQFLLLCSFWQKVIKDQCRVKSFKKMDLEFYLIDIGCSWQWSSCFL